MTIKRFCLSALVVGLLSSGAQAQGWEFSVTPYLMGPFMDGQTGVGPVDANVSASAGDVFRNLNWGAMGILEANNGKFGVAADLTYMNLKANHDGAIDRVGGHQGSYTGMLLARIDPHAEIYVGARVNDLGVSISGTGPLGNARSASGSQTWVDPIVGMRVILPFSEKVDLTMMADIGGFGIGSDIAVQAWPSLGLKLGSSVKAMAGYRLVYVDYSTGEGADRFKYDVLTHGPTVGFQIRF